MCSLQYTKEECGDDSKRSTELRENYVIHIGKAENQRFKYLSRGSKYNRYGVGCIRGKESSYIGRNFSFNLHVANREIRRFLNDIGSVNGITKRNTTYVNYETNQKKEKGQGGDRRKMRVQRSLKGFLFAQARTSVCPPCENDASKSWKIATAVQAQGESL